MSDTLTPAQRRALGWLATKGGAAAMSDFRRAGFQVRTVDALVRKGALTVQSITSDAGTTYNWFRAVER